MAEQGAAESVGGRTAMRWACRQDKVERRKAKGERARKGMSRKTMDLAQRTGAGCEARTEEKVASRDRQLMPRGGKQTVTCHNAGHTVIV